MWQAFHLSLSIFKFFTKNDRSINIRYVAFLFFSHFSSHPKWNQKQNNTKKSNSRTANRSQIPDVALSKPIPKIYSHHSRTSPPHAAVSSRIHLDGQSSSSTGTGEGDRNNDSTLITIPNSLYGRNGIKPKFIALAQHKYDTNPNDNKSTSTTTGDNTSTEYCNTNNNSGTGEAKAYKLLKPLS